LNVTSNLFDVRTRAQIMVRSGIILIALCALSAAFAYATFHNYGAEIVSRAVFLGVVTPVLLAIPVMFLVHLRFEKIFELREVLDLREKELGEFINIIPDIVARSDPDMRLTFANQQYCEIVGRDIDFLIGRDFTEFVHPSALDAVNLSVAALTPEHPTHSHKQFHIHPDGTERWIYWTNLMRYGLDNKPFEILSVGKDITELHFAQKKIETQAEKLEIANQSLESANQELKNFTSIASHDLQEPLRKINFFCDILAEAIAEGDQKTIDYALEVMSDSAQRGRSLVTKLLSLSRTSNQLPERRSLEIGNLVNSVLSDLAVPIEQSGATVTISLDNVRVRGDTQLASEIFLNLIQNAIKFKHPDRDPAVHIYLAERDARKVVIAVKDNGIGFPEEHADNIFDAFQRLHPRHRYEGTGMGLAIVAKAAEHLDWTVSTESIPDNGATFHVIIPIDSEDIP